MTRAALTGICAIAVAVAGVLVTSPGCAGRAEMTAVSDPAPAERLWASPVGAAADTRLLGPEERGASAAPVAVESRQEPWRFAEIPGYVIHTPSYMVHTTVHYDRLLERLPLFLESAMTRYSTALARLPRPSRPLESYLFRDRRQWNAKTRQLLPDHAEAFRNLGRGGFATRGISVLYYIDSAGRDRDTFAIAAHEGWHQYTQSTFQEPLPIWLEEGIATYMEGYRFPYGGTRVEFTPQRNYERARALGKAVDGGHLIPLSELLHDSPQAFLEEGKDRLLVYYAQVWALTRFLVEYDGGRYRAGLEEILKDAAMGRFVQRLRRSPAVLARDGRRRMVSAREGPWAIYAYLTTDQALFEREYLEFVRSVAR